MVYLVHSRNPSSQYPDCETCSIPEKAQHLSWELLIATVALRIRQSLELPVVLQTTADEIHQLLHCDRVLLYQFDSDWGGQVVVEAISAPQWSVIDQVVRDTCFEACWLEAYHEGRFAAIADVAAANLSTCYADFLNQFHIKANLVIPVLHEANVWGLLVAHQCTAPRRWQIEEIQGLQQIAVHLSIAIHQASLLAQWQNAKADLETQVASRTAELEQANQKLAQKIDDYTQVVTQLHEEQAILHQQQAQLAQLAAIVASSQDAIVSKTLDGIITSWNQAAERLFGYTAAEMIGQSVSRLIPQDRQTEEAVILQRIRQGDRVETYETQRQHKLGYLVDVALTVSPIVDAGGKVIGASKIARDIRERKQLEATREQAEAELRQSQAQIEDFFDNASDLIQSVSLQSGQFLYVNRTWCEVLGYDRQELPSLTIFDLIAPECLAPCQSLFRQLQSLEISGIEQATVTFVTKEGRQVFLEGSINVRQEAGVPVATRAILRDVTVKRQTEHILHEQAATLHSFYNSAPLMMGIVELSEHDILHISDNLATATFFHTAPEALAGQWASQLGPTTEQIQCWMDHYRTSQEQERPVRFEYAHATDTTTHWMSATVAFIGIAASQRPRFSYVVEDISDRKRAELELQTLSDRLTLALSSGAIGTWDLDLTHEVEGATWDQQMYKIYGLQHLGRPAIYQDWHDCVHPDNILAVETAFQAAIQDNQEFNVEFRIYRQNDGELRWIKALGLLQRNAQGKPIRIIGLNYDITDQKQAELALQHSEARYRHIIETTLEGVWMSNLERKTTFVNRRMAEMLGYSAAEMLGSTLIDFVDPADQPQAREHLNQLYEQGVQEQYPFKLRRKDGSILWVMISATPLVNADGTMTGGIGLLTDITPLVTVQDALKTSEMQLSSVLNSSLDGIMAFRSVRNDQGTLIDFEWLLSNPTACELIGRQPEDLIGKQLLQEMPGNREDGLFDLYVQVVETGEPMRRSFYYNHEGLESWFETIAVKLGDGFAVTFRDITAIKQSELVLQQVNQQLEDRVVDLNQRHAEMLVLSEMSDFLQACLTVKEACAVIVSLLTPIFPDCSGGIFVTGASRNRLENMGGWGTPLHSQSDFQPKDCWALRRGRVHAAEPHQAGLRCNHIPADASVSTTLCIPMIAQGETLGLFYLSAETPTALPDVKRQLARTVSEQVALAIANLNLRETLQHQSIRDPLTGLFNRRYLEASLTQEVARAQRQHHEIGVIMLDIDHFKQFNDTYGHDAGDAVLQTVGSLLQDSMRGSDIVCRYGGEELTLILPETSLPETQAKASDLCQAIAQIKLSHRGQMLSQVTASFGVACFPHHGMTGAAVIQLADAALYRAKAAGRNQVIVAPCVGVIAP